MSSLKNTVVLKIDPRNPDNNIISYSAKVIKDGGLVAFPTETVYGLGANLLNKQAMDRLCKVKKRPKGKAFTVHISNLKMIERMGCKITKEAIALVEKFWPGPLTIILSSKDGKKVGFRMPANKIALSLIDASGVPVAAPSANTSGRTPPDSAKGVLNSLDGKIDLLLDSGRTDVGIESTVIDMTVKPPKILREGAIKQEELSKIIYE